MRASRSSVLALSTWHETHRTLVHTWHCDHYGHMNVRFYAHFFDDALITPPEARDPQLLGRLDAVLGRVLAGPKP